MTVDPSVITRAEALLKDIERTIAECRTDRPPQHGFGCPKDGEPLTEPCDHEECRDEDCHLCIERKRDADCIRSLLSLLIGSSRSAQEELNGPAGGAPVGQAEPTESTGALIARARAFADEAYWNRSNKQARDIINALIDVIQPPVSTTATR